MPPRGDDDPPEFLFDDAPPSVAADEVAAWADGRKERRKGPPKLSERRIAAIRESAERRRLDQDWDDAEPAELVALYAWCHHRVYSVACEVDSDRGAYYQAARLAARMLEKEFSGDVIEMVGGYMRWVWMREKQQLPKRSGDFRIGWRYMFKVGGGLLIDWRMAKLRSKR
jgi:hypothetical protein